MNRIAVKLSVTFTILVLIINGLLAQGLPVATPESLGFSAERLKRIDAVLEDYIHKGLTPGAVVLVARHGKAAHFKALGKQDIERNIPMSKNTMFRIASMTKAITTVGAMMLFEAGKFSLDDPLSKYIPEFKSPKVMVEDATTENGYILEDAKSPILIRHLLTHTSGISYKLFARPQLAAMYQEAGISDGLTYTDETLESWVTKLATVPLAHQPGENFEYGLNTDVLGRLIEIWSGEPLDVFLQQRIFEPLQMTDTHFFLPKEKIDQLATLYEFNAEGKLTRMPDAGQKFGNSIITPGFPYNGPQTFFSGGGGLVCTAGDYARFSQMLLNGGKLDGVQLLSRKTVELITSNQIGKLGYWDMGYGFGFGFYISRGPEHQKQVCSEGTYGWSGYFSTYYWIDPKEDIVVILMMQVAPWSPFIENEFMTYIYQALTE